MNHDDYALWDGAYVLGALSSADRREFEDHMLSCERCAAAVAELTVLPGLLGTVPLDIALTEPGPAAFPASGGDDRLFEAIRSGRRRARVRDSIIAVAAAVAVAVPIGYASSRIDSPGPIPMAAMTDTVPTVIDAGVALTSHTWGTTVSLECSYRVAEPDGIDRYGTDTEEYALTVTDLSGHVSRLATWIGSPGETVTPQASTSVALAAIRSVDIRATDSGDVLLTAAP